MEKLLSVEVQAIQGISAVPTILEAVAAITGLGFVCVAHVTCDSWTTCAVLDKLNFGLEPGDQLDVTTTLCEEVRDTGKAIVIDKVSDDPHYHNHPTPLMYGFQSYISIPIFRPSGDYFGTLCGLDPQPANLSNTATIASMTMFAQLISLQLASENHLAKVNEALVIERETAELREQFIAMLGHDLRNPLSAISNGASLLAMMPEIGQRAASVVQRIQRSAERITGLMDNVLDFTRGKMGGGIGLELHHENGLAKLLKEVVSELVTSHPNHQIQADIDSQIALVCDKGRIGQLLSNLLKNALIHGDASHPIQVEAHSRDGIFQLCVTNVGPAIPPDVLPQLFKPYWRSANRGASEGLGLGLFIVSEIAKSHGGEIAVNSFEGATSFIFTMASAEFVERRVAQSTEYRRERRYS